MSFNEEVLGVIESLEDSSDYIWYEDNTWWVTNEWLCGTFCGRAFTSTSKDIAVTEMVDYFNKHIGHKSIVGKIVSVSGWPDLKSVKKYIEKEGVLSN